IVVIGTRDSGTYRSLDSGVTWTPCNSGFPGGSVSVLGTYGNNIVAATQNPNSVVYSSNDGSSWKKLIYDFSYPSVGPLAALGNTLFTDYPALLRSTSGGKDWDPIGPDADNKYTILSVTNGKLYITGDTGIVSSPDSGSHWTYIKGGLSNRVFAY